MHEQVDDPLRLAPGSAAACGASGFGDRRRRRRGPPARAARPAPGRRSRRRPAAGTRGASVATGKWLPDVGRFMLTSAAGRGGARARADAVTSWYNVDGRGASYRFLGRSIANRGVAAGRCPRGSGSGSSGWPSGSPRPRPVPESLFPGARPVVFGSIFLLIGLLGELVALALSRRRPGPTDAPRHPPGRRPRRPGASRRRPPRAEPGRPPVRRLSRPSTAEPPAAGRVATATGPRDEPAVARAGRDRLALRRARRPGLVGRRDRRGAPGAAPRGGAGSRPRRSATARR